MANVTVPTIKVGDTVWLNSGSPSLCVTNIEGDRVFVTWCSDTLNQIERAEFPAPCLRLTDPYAPPLRAVS